MNILRKLFTLLALGLALNAPMISARTIQAEDEKEKTETTYFTAKNIGIATIGSTVAFLTIVILSDYKKIQTFFEKNPYQLIELRENPVTGRILRGIGSMCELVDNSIQYTVGLFSETEQDSEALGAAAVTATEFVQGAIRQA